MKYLIILLIICFLCAMYSIIPTYIFKIYYKIKISSKKQDRNIILTFDDGPSEKYTLQLMDLLKKYHVHATFFVVANFAQNNPHIIKKMKEEGHCIGLHSLDHSNSLFKGYSVTKKEFVNAFNIMKNLNCNIKYFRPPWGQISLPMLYLIKKHKLKLVMWNVMAEDWSKYSTIKSIKEKLLRRVKNGSIICLHDGRGADKAPLKTIHGLKSAIPTLLDNKYKFISLDDYYGKEALCKENVS